MQKKSRWLQKFTNQMFFCLSTWQMAVSAWVTYVEWRGGGLEEEVTPMCPGKCCKVPAWGQQSPFCEKSYFRCKGLIVNSLDTSNPKLKIEARKDLVKIKQKVRAPKARLNLLERQSVFWLTPRSRTGSFIGSEGLGKGQLDLAPGWTGSYENQMTWL